MTGKVFCDTNIFVYAFNSSDDEKHEKAKDILKSLIEYQNSVCSAQVINEFFAVVTRKISNPVSDIKAKELIDFISDYIQISPLTITTTYRAIELKSKYKLSFWDSLIVAAALEAECAIIYTEDMNDGQVFEDCIRVVNPLKA